MTQGFEPCPETPAQELSEGSSPPQLASPVHRLRPPAIGCTLPLDRKRVLVAPCGQDCSLALSSGTRRLTLRVCHLGGVGQGEGRCSQGPACLQGSGWTLAFSSAPTAPGPFPVARFRGRARNLVGQGSFLTGRSSGQLWVEQGDMDPGLMEVGA